MKTNYNKTVKSVGTQFILLLFSLFIFSCGDDPVVPPTKPNPKPEEPKPEEPAPLANWFSWDPVTPDADKELTIYFKAPSGSGLYNYKDDVYVHIGVISEGQWEFVPAEWDQNLLKCKMTPVEGESNAWSIELSPSIRTWFKSGETPINEIGIIARSADGTKKGNKDDANYFIENITDSKYKPFQPGDIKTGSLPGGLKHGINIVDNSTVTFVLFDKDKNGARKDFAHVVGDFNDWTLSNDDQSQMYRDDAAGVWWITITGLDPTKEYAFQYYMGKTGESSFRVADPYSRKILDPSNDHYIPESTYPASGRTYPDGAIGIVSVFKTVEESYNWKVTNFEIPSRDNLVIYEMLLRDFTDAGDLKGAMDKLDYLESLGVNAIELMPIQEFTGNDSWGYNPTFFFAMDKAYGTDQMYKVFIDECHKRGIAIIIDVVYNHADNNNPYAKMWWKSDKPATNNPFFNVEAHHPYTFFNDFNHEAQIDGKYIVRDFVKRNLVFLLEEYNIDGFRFDFTKGFTQKSSTESNFSNYDASRVAILKEYNEAIKAIKPEAYVILEHFADDREETELSNEGMMVWRNLNWQYGQSAMGFKDDSDFRRAYYGTSSRLSNSLISYMESHDEERIAYKQLTWGNGIIKTNLDARMKQLETNAAFFFTVPGPKMIWQFGELGYDISIDENGRTGKKPVKWDYQGITSRNQLNKTYSSLINLRMEHEELFNSTATLKWEVTPTFWEQGRFITLSSFGNFKQVVVVGNFTNETITASTKFPATGTWYNYMNQSETFNVTSSTMTINVPANSFRIYSTFRD